MTISKLPIEATRAAVDAKQSPLASYLAGHLASSTMSRGLAYDLIRPVAEGALALASLYEFDPTEKVVFQRGINSPSTVSLLDAALLLSNKNQAADVNRAWPVDLSGFGPHLDTKDLRGRLRGVDAEWLAAALTAAGCNPWAGFTLGEDELPAAVVIAIESGMGGLVDRFLDCPGAPTANDLVGVPFSSTSPHYNWTTLASDDRQNRVLEVLLRRGAKSNDEDVLVEALSQATLPAVKLLATAGMIPSSEAARKKIESAWKERSALLSTDKIQEMQVSAFGDVSNAMSKSSLDVGNLLSVEWSKAPSGSSSQAYDFMGNTTPETLLGQADVKKGPMAGHWSVLAAAAASRLRQGGTDGALGWSISTMLHRHYDKEQQRWILADCSNPPFKGSLSGALGFDWRPGVSVDGIVALALFGQRGKQENRKSPDNIEEQQVLKDIADFGLAADISNPTQWARDHAQSAALATVHVLKSPKVNATRSLLHAWETALFRNPGMASAVNAQSKVDLLLALTGKFQLSTTWTSTAATPHAHARTSFVSIASTLFPGLAGARDPLNLDPQSVPMTAAIITYLASPRRSGESLQDRLDRVLARRLDMGKAEIQIVNKWIDSLSVSPEESGQMKATVEQWTLDQNTPQAPAARRNPRL